MPGLGNIIYLSVAVLLPLIPAFLLFKALPSGSDVEGPWRGLKIKLGGAFGGYFLLLITIFGFSKTLPSYEVWTVRGQLEFSDGGGVLDENLVRFILKPPRIAVYPDGTFDIPVFALPDPSGSPRLPVLIVEQAGYRPAAVDLEEDVTKRRLSRRIEVLERVVLNPIPPPQNHNDP